MRFVRVPPYESWAFWTNFYFSCENGDFFGVKRVAPSSTLKNRKSKKKLASLYAHTHAYTQIRDGEGKSASPPSQIGLNQIIIRFAIYNSIASPSVCPRQSCALALPDTPTTHLKRDRF